MEQLSGIDFERLAQLCNDISATGIMARCALRVWTDSLGGHGARALAFAQGLPLLVDDAIAQLENLNDGPPLLT